MRSLARIAIFCCAMIGLHCSHSDEIRIEAPGIQEAILTVKSLSNGNILSQNRVHLENQKTFSAAFLGVGLERFQIEITSAAYEDHFGQVSVFTVDQKLSAAFDGIPENQILQINIFTTLADFIREHNQSKVASTYEDLIAKQFGLGSLQNITPIYESSVMLDEASKYGSLILSFEALAHDLGWNVGSLMHRICQDIELDGRISHVNIYNIMNNGKVYDDQILKARFAGAFYRTSMQNMNIAESLLVSFANSISKNHSLELFDENVLDMEFETTPPQILETTIPSGLIGSSMDLDVEIQDSESNPSWTTIHIEYDGGETVSLSNELSHPSHFVAHVVAEEFAPGNAKVVIQGEDLFGNSEIWEYPVEF